jgi:hypothetical protein
VKRVFLAIRRALHEAKATAGAMIIRIPGRGIPARLIAGQVVHFSTGANGPLFDRP